jgi:hypothetical protein
MIEKRQNRRIKMEAIKKRYLVDEKNKKIGVQLNIRTFEKMEEVIENYALYKLMNENKNEKRLNVREAKKYYKRLDKAG